MPRKDSTQTQGARSESNAETPQGNFGQISGVHIKRRADKRLLVHWSRRRDLNPRPLGPEPSALPNCATPRQLFYYNKRHTVLQAFFIGFLQNSPRAASFETARGVRLCVLPHGRLFRRAQTHFVPEFSVFGDQRRNDRQRERHKPLLCSECAHSERRTDRRQRGKARNSAQ